MDTEMIIRDAGFFRELSAASRSELSKVALVRDVSKKEILFVEGDSGHSLYLLVEGNVQLHKTAPDGTEVVIKVIQPGEVFAEVVLFEKDTFPATAVALVESRVCLFPRREIDRLLEQRAFRADFMAMLLRKQRYLTERIYYLMSCDVEERLFQFLREHCGGGTELSVNLSKRDVAAAIGATPETLSRVLLRLEKRGVMKWAGKTVVLREERFDAAEGTAKKKE